MPDFHRQCELVRPTKDGIQAMVSYIPENFANPGSYLRLKNEDGTWTNGWQVRAVYSRRLSKDVAEHSRDHLKQRAASDI